MLNPPRLPAIHWNTSASLISSIIGYLQCFVPFVVALLVSEDSASGTWNHRSMDCKQVCKNVGIYWDGKLPAQESARVEAHLADCSSCRRELEFLRALGRAFSTPSAFDNSEALWAAIERRISRR